MDQLVPLAGHSPVALATTPNAQGQASTVYTASNTTSAEDGVTISATVQGTPVTGNASLTVGGSTLFLSLGTGKHHRRAEPDAVRAAVVGGGRRFRGQRRQ